MLLYFIQNTGNSKMILATSINFFCMVLMIVSWVNYVGAMDNYKDMLQKYQKQFELEVNQIEDK